MDNALAINATEILTHAIIYLDKQRAACIKWPIVDPDRRAEFEIIDSAQDLLLTLIQSNSEKEGDEGQ